MIDESLLQDIEVSDGADKQIKVVYLNIYASILAKMAEREKSDKDYK